MKVIIEIDTNTNAFVNEPSQEVAHILAELARDIVHVSSFSEGYDHALRDLYGNEVGYLTIISDKSTWVIGDPELRYR